MRFVEGLHDSADTFMIVGVLCVIAIEKSHTHLLLFEVVEPKLDEILDLMLIHELHVVYVPILLSLQRHVVRLAAVTEAMRVRPVVVARFVYFQPQVGGRQAMYAAALLRMGVTLPSFIRQIAVEGCVSCLPHRVEAIYAFGIFPMIAFFFRRRGVLHFAVDKALETFACLSVTAFVALSLFTRRIWDRLLGLFLFVGYDDYLSHFVRCLRALRTFGRGTVFAPRRLLWVVGWARYGIGGLGLPRRYCGGVGLFGRVYVIRGIRGESRSLARESWRVVGQFGVVGDEAGNRLSR